LRRVLTNLGLTLAVIVLAVALVEAAAAFYAHVIAEVPHYDIKQFRLTRPPPYANSPYFSKDFITESLTEPRGWTTPRGEEFVLPNDFSGIWFNIKDGRRVTVGVPPHPLHRLYLFGASTLYCAEVPDQYTVASFLQASLNAAQPGIWEVQNYGVISATTRQQLLRLKTVKVAEGDVVVFYDGPTDLERIYNGNARGWVLDDGRKALESYSLAERFILFLNRKLARYSIFVREFVLLRPKRPDVIGNPALVAENLKNTSDAYRANLREAADFAQAHGARFVHFLQPNLYTLASWTAYEERLEKAASRDTPGIGEAYRIGYPALRKIVQDNKEQGMESHDLTGLFDRRPPGDEVYLDMSHLAEIGNLRVAAAIFEATFPDLANRKTATKP
jgi:hypothetical protein